MGFCTKCGAEVKEYERFCNECGNPVQKIVIKEADSLNSGGDILRMGDETASQAAVGKESLTRQGTKLKFRPGYLFFLIPLVIIAALYLLLSRSSVNTQGNTFDNMLYGGMAAAQGDWIYYTDEKNGLFKMNEKSGIIQPLDKDNCFSINVIGPWVYYSNDKGIYKIGTDGQNKTRISEEKNDLSIQMVTKSYIYYAEGNKLARMNLDGTGKKDIGESTAIIGTTAGKMVLLEYNMAEFASSAALTPTYKLYTANKDGGNKNSIGKIKSHMGYIHVEGSKIYYLDADKQRLMEYNSKSDSSTQVIDRDMNICSISDGWIYYTDKGNNLNRIRLNGQDEKKLASEGGYSLSIVGNWILYRNNNDGTTYRMRTNGSENQMLSK